MSRYIEELTKDPQAIIELLENAKQHGASSKEGREKLVAIKDMLIAT